MEVWTGWRNVDDPPDRRFPAAYRYRMVFGDRPLMIPRWLAKDHDGILLIGSTENMWNRCTQLRKARSDGYGTSTMNLLYFVEQYTELGRRHPNATVQYQCMITQKCREWEARLIKRYIRRFGEPPPLNCSVPDRFRGWEDATEEIAEGTVGRVNGRAPHTARPRSVVRFVGNRRH
jgi:hypothetical protein